MTPTIFERLQGKESSKKIKEKIDSLWLEIHNKGKLSKEILMNIRNVIKKYIDTSEENIEILSLWVIGTYFHSQFETFPLLQLYAQKRSGKTRTLKLLSSLAKGSDGSVSTSPTETLLFRHKEGALFFDEMECISSKERGAFRETLNAVYKRGNKIIRYKEVRKDGIKDWVEENFYPYYPIGLANINGLGDVLGDRAIQIILRRSNKKITKLVEDFSTNNEITKLKGELSLINAEIPQNFFSDWNNYIQGLEFCNKELIEIFDKIQQTEIYGRNLELFFPLIIIAYLCKDVDNFLITAKEFVTAKDEEELFEDVDEKLKQFLYKLEVSNYIPVRTLCETFRESLENPEVWVNEKWLGRAIKRLGLVKHKRQVNGKSQVLLNINPTNTTNTINTINPTNTTKKEVELVEFVDNRELVEKKNNSTNWEDSITFK